MLLGTSDGNFAWDYRTTLSLDHRRASTTVLITENIGRHSTGGPLQQQRHASGTLDPDQLGLRPPELRRVHGLRQRLQRRNGARVGGKTARTSATYPTTSGGKLVDGAGWTARTSRARSRRSTPATRSPIDGAFPFPSATTRAGSS